MGQQDVLQWLKERPGWWSTEDIRNSLRKKDKFFSGQSVSINLKKLCAWNFVEKKPHDFRVGYLYCYNHDRK